MINKFNIDQVFEHDFIIDSKIQDLFIEISKDSNPMHTIDAYAMKFGFENKIMHGNILNSFVVAAVIFFATVYYQQWSDFSKRKKDKLQFGYKY